MPILHSVSKELPAPPYPEDTRIRGWRFQLDHERINQSVTWALATQDMRPWLYMLWITAWQQIPAGSYEHDDQVIAARIGMDERLFLVHRDILMRGWVLHSDNRLYHPVITEQVLDYLELRERKARNQKSYRERKKQRELELRNKESDRSLDGHSPVSDRTMTAPEPEPEPEPEPYPPIVPPFGGQEAMSPGSRPSPPATPPEKVPNPTTSLSGRAPTLPRWEDAKKVLDHLNEKTGRKFRFRNRDGKMSKNAELIRARLKEHTVEDLLAVIDLKCQQWGKSDRWSTYLRPMTLFQASKCENYIGEVSNPRGKREGLAEYLRRQQEGDNVIEGEFEVEA